MRKIGGMKLSCLIPVFALLLPAMVRATTFTVTSTANSGAGTLRQAILDANADASATTLLPHRIEFGIAGTGVKTITLTSTLSNISRPTVVDGSTQTGYAAGGQPKVRITFNFVAANLNGLTFLSTADGSIARALNIIEFGGNGAGVLLNGLDNASVDACWLGVDSDGETARGGGAGVRLQNAVSCSVTGCVLSGNDFGADFTGTTNKCSLSGCLIGFGAAGFATGNATSGIRIVSTAFQNTIGGAGSTGRNLIAHNTTAGVDCDGDSCTYRNNFIGMLPSDYNLSGQVFGIRLGAAAEGNSIGSTISGSANHIANHSSGAGLFITGSNTTVKGNRFGLSPGNAVRGNRFDIYITDDASSSDISENTMAGTVDSVVVAQSAAGNPLGHAIRRNSIRTSKLGINLIPTGEGASAVTPNDAGDGDGGPNNLMNFPVISSVQKPAANTVVTGTLNSGAGLAAGTPAIIDVYRSSLDQRTGHTWVGSTTIALSGAGTVPWTVTVAGAFPGEWFTATATLDAVGKADTSEFSAAVQAVPGTISFNPSTDLTLTEGSGAATVALVRSGGTYGSVTASIVFNAGTAIPGTDTVQTSASITFADGSTTASPALSVTPVNDTLYELTESLTLEIAAVTGDASIGTAARTVQIADNDTQPAVSVAIVPAVTEGAVQTFTISLSAASGAPAAVIYTTQNGTALAGADFTAVSGTINFTPGQTSKTVAVTTLDDTIAEPGQNYTFRLSSPTGCSLGVPSAILATINDNDPLPSLVAGPAVFAVEEDTTAHDLVFKVSLNAVTDRNVKIRVATVNGTAVGGQDYEAFDENIEILAGQLSVDVPVKLNPAAGTEPDETLALLVEPLGGAAPGNFNISGTIMQAGVRGFSVAGSSASILCPVTSGLTWKVETSTSLNGPWTAATVEPNSPGGLRTFIAPATGARVFYRVVPAN